MVRDGASARPRHEETPPMSTATDLPDIPVPPTIRSRFVEDINGLRMHVLESGFETRGRPCLLLLHGFPELAYSWRKVMPALAEAGYHVIAPDQRGYGRTTGCSIWCATRSGWLQPSATNTSMPWSAMISAAASRPGARWCGRMCFA